MCEVGVVDENGKGHVALQVALSVELICEGHEDSLSF